MNYFKHKIQRVKEKPGEEIACTRMGDYRALGDRPKPSSDSKGGGSLLIYRIFIFFTA